MTEKTVIMIAGANGSGKSSLIANNWKLTPNFYICPELLIDGSSTNKTNYNKRAQYRYRLKRLQTTNPSLHNTLMVKFIQSLEEIEQALQHG